VGEVEKRLGPIDVLVSNAGVQKRIFFLDLQEADWDWIVDTNLKGCYLVGQAVAARMKERGRGKIVNVSSEAAGFRRSAWPLTAFPRPAWPCSPSAWRWSWRSTGSA